MLKQYQEVQLKKERLVEKLLDETIILHKGQEGIVVEVHNLPGLPIGYTVEFFNDKGEGVAVSTLEEKYLIPIGPPPPDHWSKVA
jgi:Domain of unknown function (DUF4926)